MQLKSQYAKVLTVTAVFYAIFTGTATLSVSTKAPTTGNVTQGSRNMSSTTSIGATNSSVSTAIPTIKRLTSKPSTLSITTATDVHPGG